MKVAKRVEKNRCTSSLDQKSKGTFKKKGLIKIKGTKAGSNSKMNLRSRRKSIFQDRVALNRGVVRLSHIPHGFYEDEMRDFFNQFGIVTNVKLCRSKKTGRSKGYAFIEFLHTEVAQIAAESMNNYLMFKRRLTASYVPPEKQGRFLFSRKINATRPPGLIKRRQEINKKNKSIDDIQYKRGCEKTLEKLKKKEEKLKKLGIDHVLKPVDVPDDVNINQRKKRKPKRKIKINPKSNSSKARNIASRKKPQGKGKPKSTRYYMRKTAVNESGN